MRVVPPLLRHRALVAGTVVFAAVATVGARSAEAATVLGISTSGNAVLETFREGADGAARGDIRWRYFFDATDPGSLAVTPDGRRAFSTAGGASVAVLGLDDRGLVTGVQQVARFGTLGRTVTQPVYSPDGRFVFFGDWDEGGVIAYRILEDGSFVRSGFAAKPGPSALAVSPDGKWLYAGQELGPNGSSRLTSYAIGADGSLSATRGESVGSSVRNMQIAPDGRTIYATSAYDELAVFRTGADGSLQQLQLLEELSANDLVVHPDGRFVYATGFDGLLTYRVEGDGRVTPVGPRQRNAGRGNETSITIAPDGRHLYTTEYSSPLLSTFTIGADGVPSATAPPVRLLGRNPAVQRALAPIPDQAPTASFSVAPGAAGTATRFDASASTDTDGTVTRYDWDFGDGRTLPDGGPTPTHDYRSPGVHDVRLTVTDAAGTSTSRVFTGTQVLRNGGPSASTVRRVQIVAGPSAGSPDTGTPSVAAPAGPNTPPVIFGLRPGTVSVPPTRGGTGSGTDPTGGRGGPAVGTIRLSRTVLSFRASGPLRVDATIARRSVIASSRRSGGRRVTHRRVAVARVRARGRGPVRVRLSNRLRPGVHRVTATVTTGDGRTTRVVVGVRVR